MLRQSVIREAQFQLLRNGNTDRPVRIVLNKYGVELLTEYISPGAPECIQVLLFDGENVDCQTVPFLEFAVHIHESTAVCSIQCRPQNRLVHPVICRHSRIELQIVQLRPVPNRIGPIFSRDFGINAPVKGVAIRKGNCFDRFAVHNKTQSKALAFLRDSFRLAEGRKIDRLRITVHTQAVDAGKARRDEVVPVEVSLAAAGDRTRILRFALDFHQAVAAGDCTGVFAVIFAGISVSDDAPDILISAQTALGTGVLDCPVAEPADAAGIASVFQ